MSESRPRNKTTVSEALIAFFCKFHPDYLCPRLLHYRCLVEKSSLCSLAMRLFVAIEIPEKIKKYLREIQNQIPEEKIRLTSDFHLTLKFLGSVDENKKKEVEEALREIPFQSFEAELTEVGLFLFRGNPRVIWVGVKIPNWLLQSQREIEERLAPFGFEPENRFTPHLTLARVKFVNNPKSFETAIKRIQLEKKKFSVNHFSLFQSHLSPKGATYEKLRNL